MVGKRILLAEDDPDVQDLVAMLLREAGYVTDTASTVANAMKLLDAAAYVLAIVDWRLADGDGLLVADSAAAMGAKTILMSGSLSQMPGGRAEGHDTIMKPFEPEELLDAVRAAIGKTDGN
jgi:DNA-binding response OmpR family regulator